MIINSYLCIEGYKWPQRMLIEQSLYCIKYASTHQMGVLCMYTVACITSLFIYDLSEQFRGHRHSKHRNALKCEMKVVEVVVFYIHTKKLLMPYLYAT